MKRIFVAVDISDDARRRVSRYIRNLRNEFPRLRVGWERAEKLHLTLKFLGDTFESDLEKLQKGVEEISGQAAKFKLEITETGVFPSVRKGRVLWIDVKGEIKGLNDLNDRLENLCESLGFSREKRGFKPHLTIGRLREPEKSKDLIEKHLKNRFEPVGFEVAEIVIYQSNLLPTGSIFSIVSKHRLR